jgi:hypothetical protein
MDTRALAVWRIAEGADTPDVVQAGGHVPWTPVPGGPTLEVPLLEILPEG